MSGEKAVQDRRGGRGITHAEGGVSRLGSRLSGERWGNPAGRASRPVLDGLGRHAPPKTRKTALSLGPALRGQRRYHGEINKLAVEEFVVALQIDQGGDLGALAILNAGG